MPEIDKSTALEMMNAITLMMGEQLKQLLGRKSRIECREVRPMIPAGIEQDYLRGTVLVEENRVHGTKQVRNLYIFKKDTVSRLTNFIMGFDADAENPLDEVAVSTFREVMSQCIHIEDNEVGSLLNIKTTGTIQNIEMSESARDIEQKVKNWNDGILLYAKYGLEIEDVLKTEFYLITTDSLLFPMENWNQDDTAPEVIETSKKRPIAVRTVAFPEFTVEDAENEIQDIGEERKRLRDISLDISIQIGRSVCKVKDVLNMKEGQVLTLDKQAGAPADIVVNGVLIGRGDVLVSGDNFAARITEIIGKKE